MRSDVLPISGISQRDLTAWEQLGAVASVPNPFLEPAFVLPAARAWGVDDVQLLVVRDGGEWLAALPVRQVRSWRSVPGRCLAVWRHGYCYLGTPLVVDRDPEAILATLVRGGLKSGASLALEWIDDDGPLTESLSAALASESRPVDVGRFERAALGSRDGADNVAQALSARHGREYRRKLRLLEREVGELAVRDESDDPQTYTRFLELERSGWKGQAGTAMACRPGHGEFLAAMGSAFARSGRFLMLSLASERQTVAMRSELIAGDTSFTFKIAFDEQFARLSPGIQLELAAIERFEASGLAFSDSCTAPDNATLNRLWPERRKLRSVVATPRRATGALAHIKWRAAVAAVPLRRKLARAQTALGER